MNKKNGLQQRVDILESALSQLGQGITLLSKEGSVEFMTEVAVQMLQRKDGLVLEGDKLSGVLEADDKRLKRMYALVLESSELGAVYKSLYVHRINQKKPYLLLTSKMKLDTEMSNEDQSLLIIIKDTDANTEHWQERLKNTFGLTNRESDFVVLLAEGRDIREISTVMSIAEDTARQYLKSCFKKMEVNKQHELVCLATDSLRKR